MANEHPSAGHRRAKTKQACHAGVNRKPFKCGVGATNALRETVGSGSGTCKGSKRDRYKRLIAKCYVEGNDIGEQMVRMGWPVASRKTAPLIWR